jgi:hypothetical protein
LQGQKELDEKIILNEIGKLNGEASENDKRKLLEASSKLFSEQKDITTFFSTTLVTISKPIIKLCQTS